MRVIDLSTLSMVGGSGIAETKIPLWWSDGTTVSSTIVGPGPGDFLTDGSSSTTGSTGILFMLSSNWPSILKFALEMTMYTSNGIYSAVSQIWDFTTGTNVGASAINTSSTSATIVRSSKFNLTSGHNYGVAVYSDGSGISSYFVDASLIVFPQ